MVQSLFTNETSQALSSQNIQGGANESLEQPTVESIARPSCSKNSNQADSTRPHSHRSRSRFSNGLASRSRSRNSNRSARIRSRSRPSEQPASCSRHSSIMSFEQRNGTRSRVSDHLTHSRSRSRISDH